ncbi:MAG: hypothetical protein KA998_00840 [Rickettsiaceae bacterium]|nr:hypothetical protein [Rickettsiaceae bacterium]
MFCSFFRVIILALLISSCGFHPVYETRGGVAHRSIPQLEISEIASVPGAMLYESLSSLIGSSPGSKYLLEISLSNASQDSIISKKSDVVEIKVIQNVSFKVIDNDSGKEILNQKFSVYGYYGAMYQPYSSYVESRGASESLAKHAADEIHRRLIIFFDSIQKGR